jgi:hypothetical protein
MGMVVIKRQKRGVGALNDEEGKMNEGEVESPK